MGLELLKRERKVQNSILHRSFDAPKMVFASHVCMHNAYMAGSCQVRGPELLTEE